MKLQHIIASGLALAGGAFIAQRARRISRVAPGLRTPLLLVPLSIPHIGVLPLLRKIMYPPVEVPDTVTTQVRSISGFEGDPSLRVQLYEPVDGRSSSGCLVWIHGGGLMLGDLNASHADAAELATELGILVVSVDYRLTPEHTFPAAINDCKAALQWVHTNAVELDIDPAKVAVGGDSAGGGLAANLAQWAFDNQVPVRFQALIYPMLDDRTALRHNEQATQSFVWSAGSNHIAWTAYRGSAPAYDEQPDYLAAARREHLEGLAPAWIGVGDLDLFLQEDLDYADRLQVAGVDCDIYVVPGMYHAGDVMVQPRPEVTKTFRQDLVRALGAALT